MRGRVGVAGRWLCLLALAGCAMPEPPGELVGVYAVEGSLTENECGTDALPAADPLMFDVELRERDGAGYWLQGAPPARPGTLSPDGAFAFELEQLYDVDPDARPMPADPFSDMDPEALADPTAYEALDPAVKDELCRLEIRERVEGSVMRRLADGDAEPADPEQPDLVADNTITISGDAGDCSLVMRDQGGPFDALPCTAHYDLVGTMLRDED